MSFFKAVNEKFFNPFCCRNRELYVACIDQLIEKSKGSRVLSETDAKNALILFLRNCEYSIEQESIIEDFISDKRSVQENASAILRYFRDCGWISQQEIGRDGDNIATVSVYCRKLIGEMHKIFEEDDDVVISNRIFAMREILISAMDKDNARLKRPYRNILVPLIENVCDLKNDLQVLKDSIRDIMQKIINIQDINSLGQFLLKDELLERFFNDYFFIKKEGMIPIYISDIDKMLHDLIESDTYNRIADELSKIEKIDIDKAKDKVCIQFEELDSFINFEYGKSMELIDDKVNSYFKLYKTRINMILNNGTNLENELNRILLLLKDSDNEKKEEILEHISESSQLMSFGYIGKKSFERKKKSEKQKPCEISVSTTSDEERKIRTEKLLSSYQGKYSMKNVRNHINNLMNGKEHISLNDIDIQTEEDVFMLVMGIIYSKTNDNPYDAELENDIIDTEIAKIRNVKFNKRAHREYSTL